MRKTGDEAITYQNADTGLRLRDFWSWGYSDLLDNTLRGSYAEFLVAAALGIDLTETRVNWDPWDLTLPTGQGELHIEVKSGSYLQAWEQKRPSPIRFSIRPASVGLKPMATPENCEGSRMCMCSAYLRKKTLPGPTH